MAFGRHRQKPEEEQIPSGEKIPSDKKIPEDETQKIVGVIQEIFPEAHVEVIEPDDKPKPKMQQERRKRVDTKIFNNVGIVGSTVEVRDFRAIVKKKGEQINTVLTGLLKEYNDKNYII